VELGDAVLVVEAPEEPEHAGLGETAIAPTRSQCRRARPGSSCWSMGAASSRRAGAGWSSTTWVPTGTWTRRSPPGCRRSACSSSPISSRPATPGTLRWDGGGRLGEILGEWGWDPLWVVTPHSRSRRMRDLSDAS
jgi:hypothetical protein